MKNKRLKVKAPGIFIPPITEKLEQQRLIIRGVVLTTTAFAPQCSPATTGYFSSE